MKTTTLRRDHPSTKEGEDDNNNNNNNVRIQKLKYKK